MKQNKAIQITRIEIARAKIRLNELRHKYDTTPHPHDELKFAREISETADQLKNLEALLELLENVE